VRRPPSRSRACSGACSGTHGVEVPIETVIFRNIGLRGGVSPARTYIPELLDDVLEGRIHPGRVLDFETTLDGIAGAYAAMDERRAVKSLVRVGTV
jgi:threonine dehydrogenase-like Zn-dependent dehydrogenase